jgi:hypothetical protein
MDTETVFEISDTNSTLTWLIAEDFIEKSIYIILSIIFVIAIIVYFNSSTFRKGLSLWSITNSKRRSKINIQDTTGKILR